MTAVSPFSFHLLFRLESFSSPNRFPSPVHLHALPSGDLANPATVLCPVSFNFPPRILIFVSTLHVPTLDFFTFSSFITPVSHTCIIPCNYVVYPQSLAPGSN